MCCWVLATPLQAGGQNQIPYLVKDLAPGVVTSSDLAADQFLTLGDRVLFANAHQVWATDGTAAGTVQLAELPCRDPNCITFLATMGRLAFFGQDHPLPGSLWRTDGTRAGTSRLASIVSLRSFVVLGRQLFFTGCSAAGCGLLRSDGTAAGTTPIAPVGGSAVAASGGKLYFFAQANGPNPPRDLWVSDGTAAGAHVVTHFDTLDLVVDVTAVAAGVVFVAHQGGEPEQLWASDGTAAGTRPVTRFTASTPFPALALKALGGRVYFAADDGTHGAQLWRSDGTAAGTVRMTNLVAPDALGVSEPSQLEEIAGKLVFFAFGQTGFEPWVAGGSPGAEQPLCPSAAACHSPEAPPLVKAGGRLYFVALAAPDVGTATAAAALWATDGTPAGTSQVAEPCAGGCDVASPLALVPLGDRVYFDVMRPPPAAPRLWASDGTAAGTRLVSLRAAVIGSLFSQLVTRAQRLAPPLGARGAQLFFAAADDGTADDLAIGQQVWVSEGTPGSELQLTDFVIPNSPFPQSFVAVGERVFFQARLPGGSVWQSDGTASGTEPVPGVSSLDFSSLTAAGGMAFYLQRDGETIQLWRADGTAGGTLKLIAFPAGTLLSSLAASPGGRLYFAVRAAGATPGQPAAIWQSDGTPQGTLKAFDCPAGTSSPSGLAVIGSDLYFAALDTQGARGIWKSDGSPAGTVQLTVFAPQQPPSPSYDPGFTAFGSRVYFTGLAPQPTLMVTDGTPAGTGPVAAPPLGPTAPFSLIAAATRLYMLDHDNHLWRSDGTAAGTTQVNAAQVSANCCLPPRLVALGDQVFFTAAAADRLVLLRSDGTAAGTAPVLDPAAFFIGGEQLVAAAGRVFFTADDGVHGFELWQTDGTAQGTRMVDDLAPGPAGSAPAGMTQAGGLLFFSADDGLSGVQLWALPLTGGPPCQPADAWLCLLGGRFRVEAAWRDSQGNLGAGHAVSLTADTGWFWFFGPDNVEVVLKVLDGRPLDGHVWVFYGALSDVEYTLTVTDTLTGVTRRYENPPGQLASVADTHAFGPLGAVSIPGPPGSPSAGAHPAPGPARAGAAGALVPPEGAGSCQAGAARLCLEQERFAVTVAWQDLSGRQGAGSTVPLTSDTGAFWFFAPANVELVVKVLDGRAVNGKFWVFYGALSDVDYTLTVTDTATGAVKTYHNPAGRLASLADTSAF
ncbi:MAG TPA: ELWxxDGT repeat protein [Thermoanaerobaculia bacterium]|nr:ELWxxDGT repeat protein [Thermoanaerobaculia bacterium]